MTFKTKKIFSQQCTTENVANGCREYFFTAENNGPY